MIGLDLQITLKIKYDYRFYSCPIFFSLPSSLFFLIFLKRINQEAYNNSIHIYLKKMINPIGAQFSSFHSIQIIPLTLCFNAVPLNFINFYSESALVQHQEINNLKNSSKEQTNIVNFQPKSLLNPRHKYLLKNSQKQEVKRQESLTQKKKKESQQQYKPSQPNKQKKTKGKVYQSARRNILPNIIHQIFCFIQKKKRSQNIVRKYIQKNSSQQIKNFSIDRFYLYQRLIKQKRNHYINLEGLCQLNQFQEPKCEVYSQEDQKSFIKMNRILIKYFLQHQFQNIALTSSRMSSETRLWNLQEKRKIMNYLIDTFRHIQ